MKKVNFLIRTDGYKVSMHNQYPPGTEYVYSYFSARNGSDFEKIKFFGLKYYLKEYLQDVIFTKEDILDAQIFYKRYFGRDDVFVTNKWFRLLEKYGGRLPVEIKAVPELYMYPKDTALFTVVNTDPEFPWIVTWLETLLSKVWYSSTVATQSAAIRDTISWYLERTGDLNNLPYALHDFGYRGSTSEESAAIGSAAHLLSFKGTDTVIGSIFLKEYYGINAGCSIPAMEHSTVTSWGFDKEFEAFSNMMDQYPEGVIACVSDSFDIYKCCEFVWGEKLIDKVKERKGLVVIRPDSGDPRTIIPHILKALESKFGCTVNEKGFKVLNNVRLIQGDGVDHSLIDNLLRTITDLNWSADNLSFGSGGALLQKVNRDTCKFAFKRSAIKLENENWKEVFKSPITDASKSSKKGLLSVYEIYNNKIITASKNSMPFQDLLQTVFKNGQLY